MKLSIIDIGKVGSAIAFYSLGLEPDELMLVDSELDRLATYHDISQAAKLMGLHKVRVFFSGDVEDVEGSDVIVVTAGRSRKHWQAMEYIAPQNLAIMRGIVEEVSRVAPHTPVVVVTNPVVEITKYWRENSENPVYPSTEELDRVRARMYGSTEKAEEVVRFILEKNGGTQWAPAVCAVNLVMDIMAEGDRE